MNNTGIITKTELLNHWIGHRVLTRKTIENFPEEELFNYSLGGMRTFSDMLKELLALSVPGLEDILNNTIEPYNPNIEVKNKEEFITKWDNATERIIELYNSISQERFNEEFNLFGEYKAPIIQNIQYFIDNEIHHRAQGFVYLRTLGIQPPFFWDRY